MKPIIARKNKPVVMEVIGIKGKKIAEYVDKGDKLPYFELQERYTNDV